MKALLRAGNGMQSETSLKASLIICLYVFLFFSPFSHLTFSGFHGRWVCLSLQSISNTFGYLLLKSFI